MAWCGLAGPVVAVLLGAAPVAAADADSTAAPAALPYRLHEVERYGSGDGVTLVEPAGVLQDAFGRVWVSDATLNVVHRWGPDRRPLDQAGSLGSEPGFFRRPGTLALLGSLGVAVLDTENQRVMSYDQHLRLLGVLVDLAGPGLEARIGRVRPRGLASDLGGAILVVDADRDRLLVFDFAGTFLRELGGFGSRAGGFSGLLAVASDARGNLVTIERPRTRPRRASPADSLVGRARLQWLDPGGRVLAVRWTPVWAAGGGEIAMAVAVDGEGRVAVCGERSRELFVFGTDGSLLAHEDGLGAPRALAFAPDGTLLVAESSLAIVRRFALERVARD